jgi:hypothetical protein
MADADRLVGNRLLLLNKVQQKPPFTVHLGQAHLSKAKLGKILKRGKMLTGYWLAITELKTMCFWTLSIGLLLLKTQHFRD